MKIEKKPCNSKTLALKGIKNVDFDKADLLKLILALRILEQRHRYFIELVQDVIYHNSLP